MVQKVVLLGILGIFAYQDYREKKISLSVLFGAGVIGMIFEFVYQRYTWKDLLLGVGLGIFLCIVSAMTRGNIGLGDGMMMIVSGIFLGAVDNLCLLLLAVFFMGMSAVFLLLVKKKERTYRIPFGPFLLGGYVLMLVGA